MPVKWLDEPEEHDYPAAASYLSLIASQDEVKALVKDLKKAPVTHQKAKDILRASQLALLDETNAHVRSDLIKVHRGEKLSPILLVRGSIRRGAALEIADGYHRVCASYYTDENTDIPVKIADFPSQGE
ncbi:hypothetical protein SPF06_19975 [Sinomonas sp. JGH33]|uniref:ParB/Sulfiredoxin domain-containing protein n=1 Tax=Sinomonas terricola TaxID=3110330 RepID=A0ABU5TBD4_9MICC|nr:hypothetical protein [Sinomonas sp. JGH33]MEA5457008.1 hypothetical protein [Sinomonas sp. JGH33]